MAQPSNENMDLFACAKENANEWELVDPNAADAPVAETAETATPAPPETNEAPPVWDDIPRDPVPPVVPEPTPEEPVLEQPVVTEPVPAEPIPAEPIPAEPVPVETVPVEKTILPAASAPGNADDAAPSYRHVAPEGISSLEEMGRYLKEIRLAEKMPVDQVCDATKIRPDYLHALEAGDASELPQAIYVLAYIRKLCDTYGVNTINLGDFFNDMRDVFSYELPESINKSIVGHESDDEQQKKVRRLAIALISAAAFLSLALVTGIVLLCVGVARSGFFTSKTALGEAEIVALQGKPVLQRYVIPARTR